MRVHSRSFRMRFGAYSFGAIQALAEPPRTRANDRVQRRDLKKLDWIRTKDVHATMKTHNAIPKPTWSPGLDAAVITESLAKTLAKVQMDDPRAPDGSPQQKAREMKKDLTENDFVVVEMPLVLSWK